MVSMIDAYLRLQKVLVYFLKVFMLTLYILQLPLKHGGIIY